MQLKFLSRTYCAALAFWDRHLAANLRLLTFCLRLSVEKNGRNARDVAREGSHSRLLPLYFFSHECLPPSLNSRSNSRAYVVYTLTAITRLSNMVKKSTGTDLWATPQVTNAVKMFTPYVNNNAPWPYPDAHSDFDWKWAAEYTRLASLAYEEPSSEDACVRTNGTQAPLYGAPTSTVHPYLSEVAARRKMQLQEK